MADSGKPTIDVALDDILQLTPTGPLNHAITNNLYGINHLQTPTPVPINKDNQGLAFFTRPQLNMTTPNLRNVRQFTPLLTNAMASYQRYIRTTLDPRLMHGYLDYQTYMCPLVDPRQAFIPLLTNHIETLSGFPDTESPTFTRKEGSYKDGFSMVDGVIVNYTTYDITANFRNSRGDPITSLFNYWRFYQSCVFEGTLLPYPDYITSNTIDYNTRIYRLILDETKTKVQRIAATGAAFPIVENIGNIFDLDNTKPYNESNSKIPVNFRCMGFIYNDDILVYYFNRTVAIFNPQMKDEYRSTMIRVPADLGPIFNNRCYPRIEPNTYTLEWWVTQEDYVAKMQAVASVEQMLGF